MLKTTHSGPWRLCCLSPERAAMAVQTTAASRPTPVHSGNRPCLVCRSGVQRREFLGSTVVLLLGLSWSPSSLLANRISSRRKLKRPRQLPRCCQRFWSSQRPDPHSGSPERRWRACYFSGHCFKGAVVEDQAAILVATVRDKVSQGPLGRGWSAHRRVGGGPSPLAKWAHMAMSKWAPPSALSVLELQGFRKVSMHPGPRAAPIASQTAEAAHSNRARGPSGGRGPRETEFH